MYVYILHKTHCVNFYNAAIIKWSWTARFLRQRQSVLHKSISLSPDVIRVITDALCAIKMALTRIQATPWYDRDATPMTRSRVGNDPLISSPNRHARLASGKQFRRFLPARNVAFDRLSRMSL